MVRIRLSLIVVLLLVVVSSSSYAARRVVYTVTHSIGSPSYGGYGTWQEYFASSVSSQSGVSSYCNNYARGPDILSAVSAELVSVDGNMATSRCTWLSSLPSPVCTPPQALDALEATCVGEASNNCTAAKDGSDLFTGFSAPPTLGAAFCPSDGEAAACASKITGAFAIVKNGVRVWTYEVGYTGSPCTPPAPSTEGVPTTCKGSPGTVNGVTVCIPVDDRNVVESLKETTTTNPVSGEDEPGSAGSVTTTRFGSCSGTSCSVTETTTTTDGTGGPAVVTTKKTDMPKEDYCKDNPRSMSCKEFNFGDLEADPIGSGGVQLSIAKAAAFGPDNAACPAPKTAVIMGKSISMPFTLLCEFAQLIRPLLIGFAYLSAALTFFGFARK